MSDRKKSPSSYASSDGKVVDDESGRRIWDGTVRTIKLSLMKTGIFQRPATGDEVSPSADPTLDTVDWNEETDESGFDPYNSSK